MRLKKIILEGFKSFAERTVICFEESITGIVGPNGCGKSNVIDAFRWVLGEQSAKSMRGESMKDVIFSGTQKRKAAAFAQVTLYFDKAKDFCGQNQLSVSRKVTKKGESLYLLNEQVVRLKDLQRLFMGSGIGRSSFSIFEQGRIDRMILASAEQRRQIFEEVAGISCFKDQSSDALKKLSHSQANVKRAEDICKEVKGRMDKLVKQADKAKDFASFKERAKELELAIFSFKLSEAKENISKHLAVKEAQEKSQETLSQEIQELQEKRKTGQAELNQTQQTLDENKRKIYETKRLADLVLQEERLKKERVEESLLRKKSLKEAFQALKKELAEQEKEQKSFEKERDRAQKDLEKSKALFLQEREKVLEGETLSSEAFEEQKRQQKELLLAKEGLAKERSLLEELKIRLKAQQEKALFFTKQKEELERRLSNLAIDEKRLVVDKLCNEIDQMKSSFQKFTQNLEYLEKSFVKEQEKAKSSEEEMAQTAVRLKALQALEEEREGFSEDVKNLLKESKRQKSAFFGLLSPLYEVLGLDQAEIRLFSRFLAPYAQTLFLKDAKALETVLDFAKREKLKDYSLCYAPQKDLKKHFLGNIQRVESLSDLEKGLPKKASEKVCDWLVADQYFLDRFSVLFTLSKRLDVFSRHAQIQDLQALFAQKENEQTQIKADFLKIEGQRKLAKEQRDVLDQDIRKKEMKLLESNLSLQNARSLEQEILDEKKRLEKSASEQKESEILAKIEQVQKNLSAKEKALEATEKAALNAEKNLQRALEKVEKQRLLLREKETLQQGQVEHLQGKSQRLQSLQLQGKELCQKMEQIEHSLKEIDKIQEDFQGEKKGLQEKAQAFDQDLRSLEKEKKTLETAFAQEKKALWQISESFSKKEKVAKQGQEKLFDVCIRLEKQEALEQSLSEQVQEHHPEHPIEEILEKKLSKPLKEAEKELKDLRQKIKSLGDVNMEAISEYEEHKERHDYLSEQLQDLQSSTQDLRDVIEELEQKSRKVFFETFESIKKAFEKHFITLFSGGEASLHLTGSDPLEGGIDIVAQPPGKQMRSIALLSGGEKCMTALALLFAIFEYKPSTFCLLDEIDAPLDDSNVARFAALLDEFVAKTQFVIVTHNKATMGIANTLLGISMEEKGISKLLKIHFSGKEKEKALLSV